jgi:hypothetical protein
MINKETKEKIIYALELGRDAAYQVAQEYHGAMAGYRQSNHDMLDNDVRMIDDAIELVKQL